MAMFCRRASTVRSGVKRVQEYKSGRVQGQEAAGENYWDGWILTQRYPDLAGTGANAKIRKT